MNGFLVFIYFCFFAIIAGGAFALMWTNVSSILKTMDKPVTRRHPEAPEAGEEVLYVDLTREKLQKLYDND